ncbi:hypothetical protein KAJ83_03415 [Marivibrio halodurans]|uniref:Uncharacterized protein n=1 Tax=Marivibrio halodurans TaxID=2039722 RepID=A0A8J7S5P2_9PROT|nr:hypothetical protein [Marivibrio halodurans]MBP5856042.1 hypothetical protein [Marivibrio halodurans]
MRYHVFTGFRLVALLLVAVLTVPGEARANAMVENAIRQAEPCSALRIDDFKLVTIAVDRFKSLTVHDVALNMENDALSAAIDATLYCEAGPDASMSGDLGGRVAIDLTADLARCRVTSVDARVSELGGRIATSLVDFLQGLGFKADVLGMLETRLASDLEDAAREEVEARCREMSAR